MPLHFDFTDIQLMLNIADSHSLTAGAEKTHLSLSAASLRIKNLEEHFATRLLYRTSQGVSLTSSGQALARHSREILLAVEQMRGDMYQYGQGVKGHVRVLANTTAMTEIMPEVIPKYLLSHPGVNVELRERLSIQVVKAIREGSADIGIVAGSSDISDVEFLPCRSNRLVLVTPRKHALDGPAVYFGDTLDYDYVGLSEWSAIHPFLVQAANTLGRALKFRIEASNFESVCRMIESGVGIGVVPASIARQLQKRMKIAIVNLRDDWSERSLYVCVRNLLELPTFSQELVQDIIKCAQDTTELDGGLAHE